MIQLFATDLDGTLLNGFHTVDGRILAAIRRVRAQGGHFAVATGRTLRSGRDFGFEGNIAVACANGSIVFGEDDELIAHTPIDPAVLEDMLRTFPQVCFECVGLKHTYATGTLAQREAGFRRDSPLRAIIMRGMRAKMNLDYRFEQTPAQILAHDICKVNARVIDPGIERALDAYLDDHAEQVIDAPFNPVMFEITDRSTNKGTAVARLARHLGISESAVAVYGDGGNDIAMLERFTNSYATSNGSGAAKRAAGTVIGSCTLHAVPRHITRTLAAQGSRIAVGREQEESGVRCQGS